MSVSEGWIYLCGILIFIVVGEMCIRYYNEVVIVIINFDIFVIVVLWEKMSVS